MGPLILQIKSVNFEEIFYSAIQMKSDFLFAIKESLEVTHL